MRPRTKRLAKYPEAKTLMIGGSGIDLPVFVSPVTHFYDDCAVSHRLQIGTA